MLVCITGQIGAGKTETLRYIASCGYKTFCMDNYIHAIYKKGCIGYNKIKKAFGSKVVTPKAINRKELGKIVTQDRKQLAKLNNITIPLMQAKLQELLKKETLCFVELGVFIHHANKFKRFFKKIIFIFTPKKYAKINQQKKFKHIKKLPTFFVGCDNSPYKNKDSSEIFYVDNSSKISDLHNKIKKILTKIKK
jgi:dephospho-CoA kinase